MLKFFWDIRDYMYKKPKWFYLFEIYEVTQGPTHFTPFEICVCFVYVSGKTEIRYLQNLAVTNQNVSCSQISMNKLKGKKSNIKYKTHPCFRSLRYLLSLSDSVNPRLIGLNIFSFKSIPYNGVSWFEMHRFSLIIIQENQLQEAALFVTLISLRYCIPFEICQANDNRSLMLRSSGSVEFPLSDCDLKYRLQRWLM